MKRILHILPVVVLIACQSKPKLEITTDEIDLYVASCLDAERIYDINLGPRYSRDDETYKADEYAYYDSLVLITCEEYSEKEFSTMNIFFKQELPVYIEQYISAYNEADGDIIERKIYLNGAEILEEHERTGVTDYELENAAYKQVELSIEDFDFERPRRATAQEGEFEMKFNEFLIINPESYLILKNEESKYGVALYILEGDELLDELFSKPLIYKGKTLKFDYEFLKMEGIERMIYRGAEVEEKKET